MFYSLTSLPLAAALFRIARSAADLPVPLVEMPQSNLQSKIRNRQLSQTPRAWRCINVVVGACGEIAPDVRPKGNYRSTRNARYISVLWRSIRSTAAALGFNAAAALFQIFDIRNRLAIQRVDHVARLQTTLL